MRVLFIYPGQFGYFTDIYEYCTILADYGYEVKYLGLNEGLQPVLNTNGVEVTHVKGSLWNLMLTSRQVIEAFEPDVIHVFQFRRASMLRLLNPSSGSSWILDVRSLHVGSVDGRMKNLWLKDQLTHIESVFFNTVLALTDDIKKRLSPNIRSISVVPLGASKAKFNRAGNNSQARARVRGQLGISDAEIVFLYSGVLAPSRRIEFVIQSFGEALKLTKIKMKLLILGGDRIGGRYEARLRTIIRSLGLEGNVIMIGRMKYPDVPPYYMACDAGVLYLPPQTPYDKQPATKILEYMMSRLLVVANATTAHKSFLPSIDYGVIFEDGPGAFSQAIARAASLIASGDQETIVSRAYNMVCQFDWQKIVLEKLVPLYLTLR